MHLHGKLSNLYIYSTKIFALSFIIFVSLSLKLIQHRYIVQQDINCRFVYCNLVQPQLNLFEIAGGKGQLSIILIKNIYAII